MFLFNFQFRGKIGVNLVLLVECVAPSVWLCVLVGAPVANLIICFCKFDEKDNMMHVVAHSVSPAF